MKSAAAAGAGLVFGGGAVHAADSARWSGTAFALAKPCTDALAVHPFLTAAFDGTLRKPVFVRYLLQNIGYLQNYALCLQAMADRVKRLQGFDEEAASLLVWAEETRSLRTWTIDYAGALLGKQVQPERIPATSALLAYEDFESKNVRDEDAGEAMASLLPCFYVWDVFGRALRPGARIEGNPMRSWVEGMGSEAAAASAAKAAALADRLAGRTDDSGRSLMTAVFLAGCWLEWQLFDAVMTA